ncbi:MAG: alkene reductase [Alphaproteobacteria bacterium]|nr:alkene reductase [Alphaproteobacteria bacterium]
MDKLFEPFKLGDITLENRVVMAPMTRSRANAEGVHGLMAVTYYTQRAGAGLLVTEATAVSKQGSGYVNIPGIWNAAQVEGWKPVTKAVHEAGGKIFLQMFHTGRIGHSSLYGEQPVAPSVKKPEGQVMAADYSMQPYETPRALAREEIPGVVAQFRNGAENAKKAGFDGIEIHGANGYLIDQFLRDGTNQRTDDYGGSPENRARFLKEIVEAAVQVWGAGRVGVRLSPSNNFNGMSDSDPLKTFSAAAEMLNNYPLAYLHTNEQQITKTLRKIYKGVLVVNGGLNKDSGEKLLRDGAADLIAFGVPFISNPDLVERMKTGVPLAQADTALFYTGGEKGYIDYPEVKKAA